LPGLSQRPEGQALLAVAESLSASPLPIHILEADTSTPALPTGTVVISVHGVRTRGAWQKALTAELNNAGFRHEPLDYGFFRVIRLLIPSSRATQVRWFLDEYTRIRQPTERKVAVIAHSFGTYIVAAALEKYAEVRLESIILCGSIVRQDFPWSRLIPHQVRDVLNDYGRGDIWVKLAEWLIADSGSSGARGFGDDAGGRVQQLLRPRFGHSDYFYRLNYQETWIPFLKGEALLQRAGSETPLRNWKFRLTKIAVFLGLLVLGLILWHFVR
jgi:pimeloyl-ACP methyl ester carboxylesterase